MFIENVHALQKFATEFARGLNAPKCVALTGVLGAGKTEFARAVIRALVGDDTVVPSPTFTLAQTYGKNISHFDLYRIKNVAELEEIGFFDALGRDIVLVEWPEIANGFLSKDTIRVRLDICGAGRELLID